jgi:hypothetical protein
MNTNVYVGKEVNKNNNFVKSDWSGVDWRSANISQCTAFLDRRRDMSDNKTIKIAALIFMVNLLYVLIYSILEATISDFTRFIIPLNEYLKILTPHLSAFYLASELVLYENQYSHRISSILHIYSISSIFGAAFLFVLLRSFSGTSKRHLRFWYEEARLNNFKFTLINTFGIFLFLVFIGYYVGVEFRIDFENKSKFLSHVHLNTFFFVLDISLYYSCLFLFTAALPRYYFLFALILKYRSVFYRRKIRERFSGLAV